MFSILINLEVKKCLRARKHCSWEFVSVTRVFIVADKSKNSKKRKIFWMMMSYYVYIVFFHPPEGYMKN